MYQLAAQGDVLIERVGDIEPCGQRLPPGPDGATVLAEGELTGHRHAIYDRVVMFRDDALARDLPLGLYIGHVKVDGRATVAHQEHDPITLEAGTYRIRRQRQVEPSDVEIVMD